MARCRPARIASSAALALLLGAPAARAQSSGQVVNVDATRAGCGACYTYPTAAPGEVDADVLSDVWVRHPALTLLAAEGLAPASILASLGRRTPRPEGSHV